MVGWITNDPEAAKHLQLADVAYQEARAKARKIAPLSAKVEALRKAKTDLQAAYDAVGAVMGPRP